MKSKLFGKFLGNVIALGSTYYFMYRIMNELIPKHISNITFIILNSILTLCFYNLNIIGTELIKIRKFLIEGKR